MNLTKTVIDKAKYEGENQKAYYLWDNDPKGFGIRIYPSGKKSFVVSYRFKGRFKISVIGSCKILPLDKARKIAKEKLVAVINGIDPGEEKSRQRQGATLKEMSLDFLEKHSKQYKKTWKEDERRIHSHLIPALGSRLVQNIKRIDVSKLHSHISQHGKYEANRVLDLLSTIFEFGRKMGYVEENHVNPARGVEKHREHKRDRWVKPSELPRLIEAIESEPNITYRAALWLFILTGARKSELLKAKWSYVDLDRNELRLPDTKAGRTHYIPLSKPAMDILMSLPRDVNNPFIFQGKNGSHLVNIDKPWRRIRAKADLLDVRLHDLRRTVGSWLATSGHSLHLIGKVLNHSNASTTQIYAHLSDDPIKQAMENHGVKILEFATVKKNLENITG